MKSKKIRKLRKYILTGLSVVCACALLAVIVFTVFAVSLNIRWKNFHQDISGCFTASYDSGSYATYDGQEVPLDRTTLNYYFTYLLNRSTIPYGVGGNPQGEQIVLHLADGATMTLTQLDTEGGTHIRWRDADGTCGFYLRSQVTFKQLSNAIKNLLINAS